jgi:GR25 family glycosyltransferase involved in LPS biosynthesis
MKICYEIFHIENLGNTANLRKDLKDKVVNHLFDKLDKLGSDAVLINNQDLYNEFIKNVFDLKPAFQFKFGEMGVWASNIAAILKFIDSEYDVLMLMEDDIQIYDEFYDLFIEYMEQIPKDWDVFSYFVHANQFDLYKEDFQNQEIVKAYQDWSMLCWVLTKDCAKKIIDDISKNGITMPIDWYIFRQPDKFTSYTLSPTARKGCDLYNTDSTFQHIDERIIL